MLREVLNVARRNRIGLTFKGFEELALKLDGLQGDLKKVTEDSLKASHKVVTERLKKAIRKNNLPQKGKYSTGLTEKNLRTEADVEWEGTVARVKVGFDLSKSLTSIFLMYGTPRHDPVAGMKAAIYGKASIKEREELQKEIFDKAIKKAMEG